VHVADEDENTSVSVVIVILSPAESAEVEVKTKVRASGSLEMVVSPFRTDALPHATDVDARIASEFTEREPTLRDPHVAVNTKLVVATSDTITFVNIAMPDAVGTVKFPPNDPVPDAFESVTKREASSPDDTIRPPASTIDTTG
jgi:hypothetical protein